MPYNPKQHRLFCAMMGNSPTAQNLRKKHKVSQKDAKKMCHEGIAKKL